MEEVKNMHHKHHKLPLMILAVVLSIYVISLTRNSFTEHNYIGQTDDRTYTITIDGRGEVTASPDIATIQLGVDSDSKEVATAQRENTEKMNSIIDQLKKIGIDKDDIKTTNYNVYPNYDYTNDRGRILLGYRVSQSVNVKIRDLEKVSDVLDFAARSGANNIGSLQFTIDEPEDLKQEARELALKNAKEKAEKLAKVAGVKLGKLVSFNEGSDYAYPQFAKSFALDAVAEGFGGAAPTPDIQPGSQDISVNVTVTFEVL